MSKFHMSETDIVIDFKNAKDRKAIIPILLDQNPGVTKEELLNLLESHGCKVGWFKADKAANFHKKKEEPKEEKLISKITVEEVKPDAEEDSRADEFVDLPWDVTAPVEIPDVVKTLVNEEIIRLMDQINELNDRKATLESKYKELMEWSLYNKF